MLGLMIIGGLILYILISLFIVRLIYKKTGNLVKKRIALVILVLIPTWDVIIGYPTFWYLCTFKSGMKIYKIVENVEGFAFNDSRNQGRFNVLGASNYLFAGYKYVDFKDLETNQYMRYFFDKKSSENCTDIKEGILGRNRYLLSDDICIAKKSISKKDISKFSYEYLMIGHSASILSFVKKQTRILDNSNNEQLGEVIDFSFGMGWVFGLLSSIETGHRSWVTCLSFNDAMSLRRDLLFKTLKAANGEKNGHD